MEKKEKVVPPSPPRVIRDETTGHAYKRVGFLGEVSCFFCFLARIIADGMVGRICASMGSANNKRGSKSC